MYNIGIGINIHNIDITSESFANQPARCVLRLVDGCSPVSAEKSLALRFYCTRCLHIFCYSMLNKTNKTMIHERWYINVKDTHVQRNLEWKRSFPCET